MDWKDCYVSCEGGEIIVGNALIERRMTSDGLITASIADKQTGYVFANDRDDTQLILSVPFDPRAADISWEAYTSDEGGLSGMSLRLRGIYRHAEGEYVREHIIYPALPFLQHKAWLTGRTAPFVPRARAKERFDGIEGTYFQKDAEATMPSEPDTVDCFALPGGHFSLQAMTFFDQTDRNDFLVKESFQTLYKNGPCRAEGSLFTIRDMVKGQSLLILRDAPLTADALHRGDCDLSVTRVRGAMRVQVMGCGLDLSRPADEACHCTAPAWPCAARAMKRRSTGRSIAPSIRANRSGPPSSCPIPGATAARTWPSAMTL